MKKLIIISLQLVMSLLVGLFIGNIISPLKAPEKVDALKKIDSIDLTKAESIETTSNHIDEDLKTFSPYTGQILEAEAIENIPFMCIIENSKDARPQSGLSEADIIYETMAEGGIPRFLAVFYENSPKVIGPVRSVRPYFIDLSREHDLPFAHCGGSTEALATISSDDSLNSINEISTGAPFWRDNARKAPHNLYTSAENVRNFIISNNYQYSKESHFDFLDNALLDSNNYASNLSMDLSNYYKTSYKYINGFYEKYMDGKLATDKNTGEALKFKNIVVQITDMSLQSDNTHIDIDLVGEGPGYILTNGKIEKINWSKDNVNSKTKLLTEDGAPLKLSRGNTIWHIVDKNSNLNFN